MDFPDNQAIADGQAIAGAAMRDAAGRLSHSLKLRVYMEDTDAGGIVYYVNYLKFMERARTDMFRVLGCAKPAVFAENLMFVVHEAKAKYHRSAELDDELQVSAVITKVAKATVFFQQRVDRLSGGDSELLCESEIKIACVSRDLRKPCAIPGDLRALLL